jgi:hypothetical protein
MKSIAEGCGARGYDFFVIGDVPSPADFELQNCQFFGVQRQLELDFKTAAATPKRHYARKNIGYLLAIANGSEILVETDDDNFPREAFWGERRRNHFSRTATKQGWLNIYRYFSDANIWPRGLPLDEVLADLPPY